MNQPVLPLLSKFEEIFCHVDVTAYSKLNYFRKNSSHNTNFIYLARNLAINTNGLTCIGYFQLQFYLLFKSAKW